MKLLCLMLLLTATYHRNYAVLARHLSCEGKCIEDYLECYENDQQEEKEDTPFVDTKQQQVISDDAPNQINYDDSFLRKRNRSLQGHVNQMLDEIVPPTCKVCNDVIVACYNRCQEETDSQHIKDSLVVLLVYIGILVPAMFLGFSFYNIPEFEKWDIIQMADLANHCHIIHVSNETSHDQYNMASSSNSISEMEHVASVGGIISTSRKNSSSSASKKAF